MSLSQNDIAKLISLLPQEHIDIFPYKVIDVVVMGRAPFLKVSANPDAMDYQIAANALKELNAQDLAQKNFNRISGGERQIALLARSLAQTTKIMLLDEPTNHLDFNNQYHLLSSIKHLCHSKGISIVASMHDPNMVTLFADTVVMIKNGKIMVQGDTNFVMTPQNISTLYDTDTCEIPRTTKKKMFLPTHIFKG
jgi:iron complex transport system ATP-binding protein